MMVEAAFGIAGILVGVAGSFGFAYYKVHGVKKLRAKLKLSWTDTNGLRIPAGHQSWVVAYDGQEPIHFVVKDASELPPEHREHARRLTRQDYEYFRQQYELLRPLHEPQVDQTPGSEATFVSRNGVDFTEARKRGI